MSISKYHVSKQLFDKATATIINGYINSSDTIALGSLMRTSYIVCEKNTTYTVSKLAGQRFIVALSTVIPAIGTTVYGRITDDTASSISITTDNDTEYLVFYYYNSNYDTVTDVEMLDSIMINTGSMPLPYEPYGDSFKDWFYREYGTETETFTTLPHEVIGDGQSNLTWSMDGNMQVNGTPTPQNPITPQETGEKTANSYNSAETSWTSGVKDDNGNTTGSTTSHFTSNFTPVKANTKYSITGIYASGSSTAARIYYYDSSKAWISRTAAMRDNPLVFETPANCAYIQVQCANGADGTDFMLVEGEYTSQTMPSFEPYGYKIPISFDSNTYTFYLSEPIRAIGDSADTAASTGTATRPCAKKEFTGNEDWQLFTSSSSSFFYVLAGNVVISLSRLTNSHGFNISAVSNGTAAGQNLFRVYAVDSYTDVATWKTYLQQQYAAGTPVTIWYVLATATTETFTAPTIPTSGSPQSFDVSTTLKPSEVSLTYHGWHEHEDTKFTT